jgi:hypothetical protein
LFLEQSSASSKKTASLNKIIPAEEQDQKTLDKTITNANEKNLDSEETKCDLVFQEQSAPIAQEEENFDDDDENIQNISTCHLKLEQNDQPLESTKINNCENSFSQSVTDYEEINSNAKSITTSAQTETLVEANREIDLEKEMISDSTDVENDIYDDEDENENEKNEILDQVNFNELSVGANNFKINYKYPKYNDQNENGEYDYDGIHDDNEDEDDEGDDDSQLEIIYI